MSKKEKKKENDSKDIAGEEKNDQNQTGEQIGKLITEEEREKIEENYNKIVKWLDDIGIKDYKLYKEKFLIKIPFEYEDFEFLSFFVISPDWVLIKTSIFELDRVDELTKSQLILELMKGNFLLNNVVYSIDVEEKSIWVQSDIPSQITFDLFKINYFSQITGIDFFIKSVIPKVNLDLDILKSTYEEDEKRLYPGDKENNDDSGLYI